MLFTPLKKVVVSAIVGALLFSPLPLAAQETLPTVRAVALPITSPARLVIPKIGVNAAVESIGQDRQGVLGLPKAYNNIAWYKQSARPGKPGNALMWGHLNGAGGPAVLWKLKKLKIGDQLTVKDENGNRIKFRVTRKQSFPYNRLPKQDLFGPSKTARLNIVTCDGVWSRASRNYSHRLIIFAELVQ